MKKFIIFLFLLLITTPVLSQELQKNGVFEFSNFSGGLNTKTSNFSLQKKEGDIVQNIRFDKELGSISKRDKTVVYGYTNTINEPVTGLYRLYLLSGTKVLLANHSNKIVKGDDSTGTFTDILTVGTANHYWQWLTWHDLAIGTDGYNQPVKYDGSSASATYLGSLLATDAGSGSGPTGVYTYKVACKTASYEVSLGAASNTITAVGNDISLSMIPICPDTYLGEDVTGRNIYRTGAGDSTYKLLSNGAIADNTSTTLTDSDADGDRTTSYSPTATCTPPKGKLSVIHNNRLWIANNPTYPSRIYYSDDSSHDYFPAINYFDIRSNDGDEITFVKNLLGKLTVGKNNTIQKIYTDGDTPASDWSISDPFSFVGCHAIYSAVNTPLGIIYLSNNGIYKFNGQYSELISDQVTPEIKDIALSNFSTVWGEYYKNAYYMAYTSLKSGGSTNNRVLVLDLLTNAYDIDLMNVNVFHVFRSGTDVEALFSGSSSIQGEIFAHTDTTQEVVHKRHSDFTGTWDTMRYVPTDGTLGQPYSSEEERTTLGDAEDPKLELAWTQTIDSVTDHPIGDSDEDYDDYILDTNTKLLIDYETTGDSQYFYDSSSYHRTISANDSVHVSGITQDSVFGTYCSIYNSDGDEYLYLDYDSNLTIDPTSLIITDGFTLDFWLKFTKQDAPSKRLYFLTVQYWSPTLDHFSFEGAYSSEKLRLYYLSANSDTAISDSAYSDLLSMPLNTWHHIAYKWKRDGTTFGQTLRMFFDGILVKEQSIIPNAIPSFVTGVGYIYWIGREYSTAPSSNGYNFRIDEYRISNLARWTEDFTPPTQPYGTSPQKPLDGIIDRPDKDGEYVSQLLDVGASRFDKLYWNETIPLSGGDVNFYLRSAATSTDTTSASWSSAITNPAGSDISSISAARYLQYKITMDTSVIDYTPIIYKDNNYNVKITYNKFGNTAETSIPIFYRTGWSDLGFPSYKKTLRKILVFYESESNGTLSVKVENLEGDTDTFDIDLEKYPSQYVEYFTSGALTGEFFRISLSEASVNDIKIKKIQLLFDLEPVY